MTRFENLMDLARLPYFEDRGGRLALADPALGPAVDMHTHLALSYGLPNRVDLGKASDETLHYLPKDRAIDLDPYINKNFSPEDLKALSHDLTFLAVTARGMRATHTVPNLAREMSELGVRQSVLLPIELPVVSSANSENWLDATAGREDFVCFGSVHPYSIGVRKRLDMLKARGVKGIKIHPAVQMCPPDNGRMLKLYKLCGERDLPILFHCGPVGIEPALGRKFSQVKRYERALAENPTTTFVLGHSGALQVELALAFANKYPNVWLECSSQGLPWVRRLCDEAPADRLTFGSDWPFYHQGIGLAKVFLATEGREAMRPRVLYDNAARLLGLPARAVA
jgi:predicted TIM-barrel fold metal-dependent hydrolase